MGGPPRDRDSPGRRDSLPAHAGQCRFVLAQGNPAPPVWLARQVQAAVGTVLNCFGGPQLVDVPFTEIVRLELGPIRASWDTLRDGRRLSARLPTRYPRSGSHPDAVVRMSRMTLFDHDHGYAIGSGMVDLFADQTAVGVERIASIQFS